MEFLHGSEDVAGVSQMLEGRKISKRHFNRVNYGPVTIICCWVWRIIGWLTNLWKSSEKPASPNCLFIQYLECVRRNSKSRIQNFSQFQPNSLSTSGWTKIINLTANWNKRGNKKAPKIRQKEQKIEQTSKAANWVSKETWLWFQTGESWRTRADDQESDEAGNEHAWDVCSNAQDGQDPEHSWLRLAPDVRFQAKTDQQPQRRKDL